MDEKSLNRRKMEKDDERFTIETVEGSGDTFADSLALAKQQAGPDRDVYLVDHDEEGREILIKMTDVEES